MISPNSSIADLLTLWPQTVPVFLKHKMSCPGCSMSAFETLEDAAHIYHVDLKQIIDDLSQTIQETTMQESIPDGEQAAAVQNGNKEPEMSTPYTFFENIAGSIETIPTESIVSRTVYRDDHLKSIVFAFAPGQELSEHTASVPAIIQILEGECALKLGEDTYSVKAGAWARMPANLPHSIVASTPVKMLLIMLP